MIIYPTSQTGKPQDPSCRPPPQVGINADYLETTSAGENFLHHSASSTQRQTQCYLCDFLLKVIIAKDFFFFLLLLT